MRAEMGENMESTRQRNFWGWLSILLTLVNIVGILSIVHFLRWHGTPYPRMDRLVDLWGGNWMLLSVGAAIVGIVRDRSKLLGIAALCIGTLSLMFFAH